MPNLHFFKWIHQVGNLGSEIYMGRYRLELIRVDWIRQIRQIRLYIIRLIRRIYL